MFTFIQDGYTEYNDNFKKHPINGYSAIFVRPNKNESYFFERFNDVWVWTKINSEGKIEKYDYKMKENFSGEDFINELRTFINFEDDWFFRVYEDEASYREYVMASTHPEFSAIQEFSRREINYYGRFVAEKINEASKEREDGEEFAKRSISFYEFTLNHILEIVDLISAQGHTPQSLDFTMQTVSMLMQMIPLTKLEDEPSQWSEIQVKKIEGDDTAKKFWVNNRMPQIIKIEYEDGSVKFMNQRATLFTDVEGKDTNLYFDSENSVKEIQMPWAFERVSIDKIPRDEISSRIYQGKMSFIGEPSPEIFEQLKQLYDDDIIMKLFSNDTNNDTENSDSEESTGENYNFPENK